MKTGIGLLLMSGKVISQYVMERGLISAHLCKWKPLVALLLRREQPIFPELESKRCGVDHIFYII